MSLTRNDIANAIALQFPPDFPAYMTAEDIAVAEQQMLERDAMAVITSLNALSADVLHEIVDACIRELDRRTRNAS